MPSLLSVFERLFQSNQPLTIAEEAYVDACVDEAMGRPNPFILPVSTEHHHVITILDFMRQDHYLNPWLQQETREQVIHDPRFSLNSIVINYQ